MKYSLPGPDCILDFNKTHNYENAPHSETDLSLYKYITSIIMTLSRWLSFNKLDHCKSYFGELDMI